MNDDTKALEITDQLQIQQTDCKKNKNSKTRKIKLYFQTNSQINNIVFVVLNVHTYILILIILLLCIINKEFNSRLFSNLIL